MKVDTTVIDSYLPKGTVAEQDPPAGSQTVGGVTVHLDISNGVAPHVTLPSVKGLSLGAAQAALAGINVSAIVVYKDTNDPKLDGVVYGMNPDAGTSVLEGSSVTLLVWAGPPEPSPSRRRATGTATANGNGNGNGGNNGTATANRAARAPSAARPCRRPAPSPCPSRTP